LKVYLVGRISLETNGVVVDEELFPGRQGRLLFAHLAAEQGRPVPRDELAEALWGETPPPTWDKALTVVVSKLRTLLNEHGIDGATALTGAFGCYRLDLPEGTWVDVVIASSAAREAEEALASADPEGAKTAAQLALSLVREPFLPGEEGEWVESKRRELGDVRGRALGVLVEACLSLDDARAAAKWGEETIALAPYSETGYRRLMEAHVAAGNRAEALRVYDRCRRLLAEELGTYPSPETEAIYRELLHASSTTSGAPTGSPEQPSPEAAASRKDPGTGRRRRLPQGRGAVLALGAAGTVVAAGALALVVAAVSPFSSASAPTSASAGENAVGVVDSSRAVPAGSVSLAASPKAIAYGQESVWVTMPDQDAVARIDPKTRTVEQTIAVGKGPSGIAVGHGFVWVANSLDGTVWQIDPRTNGGQVVNRIRVGNGPGAVAYGLGHVWVANSLDRTVQRIDPVSGEPGPAITVDAGADALAVGDGAVWVTSEAAGVLSHLDPRSRSVTPINVGNGPVAVAASRKAVWVANSEDASVWRIDPATNRVRDTITVGEGPSGVALTPGGGSVWVSSQLAGTLSKIDPAARRVVKVVRVGDVPQGVAATPDAARSRWRWRILPWPTVRPSASRSTRPTGTRPGSC
jgi:YVTN family beta-propeller protein